jgi:hypothetical protein
MLAKRSLAIRHGGSADSLLQSAQHVTSRLKAFVGPKSYGALDQDQNTHNFSYPGGRPLKYKPYI